MRKLAILISAAMIVTVMLVGGCAKPAPGPTPASAPPKTFDIGIVTPLTGPLAHLGAMMQNGILMAIDDQNEQGGVTIAGQKYTLNAIIRDSKADVVAGRNIAEELIFDKGVKVMAGPFMGDAVGVQSITERNKVIVFFLIAILPGVCGPEKPYSFFYGQGPLSEALLVSAYTQEFYPEAKTVVSIITDVPDLPVFTNAADTMCKRYGLNWLGYEKFPTTVSDFMPTISRTLSKNPDIIDTSNVGGVMGGKCALLIKQLREAGFKGIIWVPAPPAPGIIEETVPKEYLTKVVDLSIDPESPIVADAFRNLGHRYTKQYNEPIAPINAMPYDPMKAFFGFLNSQNAMDTTAWMQGFEKYHWQGVWGKEAFWVGKPLFGINRILLGSRWVSEWTDGKLETKWEAPIPLELWIEQ